MHVLFFSSLCRPTRLGELVSEERLSLPLPGLLACSRSGCPGMLIFAFLPIVSLLPISNFFFTDADTVISTQSAWPHSPAPGSVTHGNKGREAGDHTPRAHVPPSPSSPPLWQSGGTQREEAPLAAVPIRDRGLTAGAERPRLPGHHAAAAGERGASPTCSSSLYFSRAAK